MRLLALWAALLLAACSQRPAKTPAWDPQALPAPDSHTVSADSLVTRPGATLTSGLRDHLFIPVYQVIPDRGQQDGYISRNGYRLSYDTYDLQEDPNLLNAWHGHIIPGIEILHGHKLVNIGYFNQKTQVRTNLFAHPVQVYHFYYPTLMQDTLAGVPVRRDYCLISVYDTDTNRDSVIDARDLRRLYHLSLPTLTQTLLVPADYAVLSSQYYPQTDQLLVYARHDANGNGRREPDEPVHVFALDMKRPQAGVRVY